MLKTFNPDDVWEFEDNRGWLIISDEQISKINDVLTDEGITDSSPKFLLIELICFRAVVHESLNQWLSDKLN